MIQGLLHLRHGDGRQVLGKQQKKEKKETKTTEHDAIFYA
jgi:hypothetical protein